GAFGGVRGEDVVVGEGVVVTSSSLEMLTNSCLGGIMVSLIFLEGLEEEALVEFIVEWFEEDEDGSLAGSKRELHRKSGSHSKISVTSDGDPVQKEISYFSFLQSTPLYHESSNA
ncbi:hypothetical protein Tco_0429537, partial [Tanacetum coccineum]